MSHPDDALTITTRRDGDTTVVVLSGELDMHSSGQLSSAIATVLDDSPREVAVDASGLSFTDSAGLRALLVARDDAEANDVVLRVVHVSEHLDRLLEITGLRAILGVPVV
jgi:anti-sigma B factor antagonist